jgi:integrase
MILVCYRQGFRASELVDQRWDQIDYNAGTMAVRRAKKGTPSTHPIRWNAGTHHSAHIAI